ncbi:MAG: hypothetical protein RML36_12070 [Anaerolineae bacterium]|nr:hypothetical protein [Anaerolineae bacterium]MDW8100206.1 hypothetical protein [Anaerolineae bacterium]
MIHTWANIALVFLAFLSLIAWAIPLVLLLFGLRGMRKARQQLYGLMPRAQARAHQATSLVEGGSRKAAQLIIRAHVWATCVLAIARALRGRPVSSSLPTKDPNEVNP